LESVFTNLIQNSVKHGRATQVRIEVELQANDRVAIRVTDNGKGFRGDATQLGRLFVRHTRGSGSGVGLYIVRQLVKRMKGAIAFQTAEGGGFETVIELPAAAGPAPQRVRERPEYEATVAGRR
jgi:signal transduction histidine kinase